MRINTVVFDLDGTLIDSATSILSSIRAAFYITGIEPVKSLTHDLIGPPLKDILLSLLNESDKGKLNQIIERFKQNYDVIGYKETRVYAGVTEMLDKLLEDKLNLYIATNKRLVPTLKIIENLNWTAKFKGIYTLDYFKPELHNKKQLLERMYKDLPYSANGAVYIGDRLEDVESAEGARIPFILAEWGYGNGLVTVENLLRIRCPSELSKKIKNI